MITLYHGPDTRSSRIVQLLMELGVMDKVDIRIVGLVRHGPDGLFGTADPANPHPEGKVPLLVHNGEMIRESNAIIQYLTEVFPSPMAPAVGDAKRGAFLGWLAYYGNVVEPVTVATLTGISNPGYQNAFRGPQELGAVLTQALTDTPFLLGDTFTAADLLMVSTYAWMPSLAPDSAPVQAWIARCLARPSHQATIDFDAAKKAAAA